MSMVLVYLFGCRSKLVMPENPTAPWVYKVELEQELDFENESIPDTETHFQATLQVQTQTVNRDDSLTFIVTFVDVQTEVDSVWLDHTMTGSSFQVRCFPWGELLTVNGWENLPSEDAQWLDFVVGALFPNPPRRKSQQWDNRMLTWPFLLNQVDHSKQIVMADWISTDRHVWQYEGEYYGKVIRTELFTGSAQGTVFSPQVWIDTHDFQWTRHLNKPIVAVQTIMGRIERQ